MTEEAKAYRRAYRRRWNKEHPDLVKAAQDRYWEKKAAEAVKDTPANGKRTTETGA